MHPNQWATNAPPRKITEREHLDFIVTCFHFLLQQAGVHVQKYTAAELAAAIRDHYSLDNPRTAWAIAFLEERADTFLTIRNY